MTLTWTPRARRFGLLHALGLAGAVGLLVARFVPVARLPFWSCSIRRTTGWPCPGCGLTRAADFVAHGRLGSAFAANPLGALVALTFGALAVLALVQWVFRTPEPRLQLSDREARAIRIGLAGALCLNYLAVILHTRLTDWP